MSRSIIDKLLTLIKDLPEDTNPDDVEEVMYHLYAKKEILKGLEDSKKENVISFVDFKKKMDEKWLRANGQ